MAAVRLINRSFILAAAFVAATMVPAFAQTTVQRLLERGANQEALQRAEEERGNPESVYFAAQAAAKMDNSGRAREEYTRLQSMGDDSWKNIGQAGAQLLEGNIDGAMQSANQAVAVNGDNAYAHYQVGLVASRQNNFQRAAQAFRRSIELKPDFAYAHYYAGIASQRLKQFAQMSDHLETFLRLAPDAPERAAVAAILRTLRG